MTVPKLAGFDMKRCVDLLLSAVGACMLCPLIIVIALWIGLTTPGPIIYWSDRIGRNNQIFRMAKFRTMRIDTPQLATHLLTGSQHWITPVGKVLRRTSLDELPQLWNILRGDMSFVGPRPALFNQDDLISLRTESGVHQLVPGLTGWAQINGRDELAIPDKVALDVYYLKNRSIWLDIAILARTFLKVVRQDDIVQADEGDSKTSTKKAA